MSVSGRCLGVGDVVDLGDEVEYLETYARAVCDAVRDNKSFMLRKFKGLARACQEFEGTILDFFFKYFVYYKRCIDYVEENYLERFLLPTTLLYLGHSFTGLVCTGILMGSLPLTYFALRQVFEGILMAVYADVRPEYRGLDYEGKIREVSRERFRNIINKVPGLDESRKNEFMELYAELSSYVHPITHKGRRGIINIAKESVKKYGGPPTYATITPTKYFMDAADEAELKRLEDNIKKVAKAIGDLINVWKETISKPRKVQQ